MLRAASRRRWRRVRRVLSLLRKATRANHQDPFRKGALIELPHEGEILITGDLHGHRANFDRIVEIADLAAHPARHLVLQEIIHQLDCWKRDRDLSYLVLEKVAHLKVQFPDQVHVLMGNHELSEIQGRVLYKDGRVLNQLFDRGIAATYGPEDGAMVKSHYKRFFRSLALAVATRSHIFLCHSIPDGRLVEEYDRAFFTADFQVLYQSRKRKLIEELVWGRDYTAEGAEEFARRVRAEILIVGHEPCDEGHAVPNPRTIILDSKDEKGCYVLLDLKKRYNQEGVLKRIRPLN